MGKRKFNSQGRKNAETIIDRSTEKNIKVELDEDTGYGGYDEANALVLPSKKRETKLKKENHTVTRILSKKQRKRLEKIVDKKKKKENRSSLLEALASVQAEERELKQYTSISTVQTVGLKKLNKWEQVKKREQQNRETDKNEESSISSIAGAKKRKRLLLLEGYNENNSDSDSDSAAKKVKDYNVVDLNEEDLYENSDTDNDDHNDTKEEPPNAESHASVQVVKVENEIENVALSKEDATIDKTENAKKKNDKENIINANLQEKEKVVHKPSTYVHLDREPSIQVARLKLPILAEEQVIMETINENEIIILAGETGSGKTTQVPQFLYEAGYAEKKLIGITEPRRVAAISMSRRVGKEMNLSEKDVSYLIRFEGNVTDQTKIKFMTDGVLLKEIESDFILSKYSVIILDEAHERSAYTDILVGLLSRIVPLRNKKKIPLKLIIMSATLRVEDFTKNSNLFQIPPPVIKIEARQFPVTIHFQKRTPTDYVREAYKKTVKIHSNLPEGGILIFLTGQQEVNYLVNKLRKRFPYELNRNWKSKESTKTKVAGTEEETVKYEDEFDMRRANKKIKKSKKKQATENSRVKLNLDNFKLPMDEDDDADFFEDTETQYSDLELQEDVELNSDPDDVKSTSQPLWVLPLYSLLSTENQNRVFEPPPEACRLCVVSTNIAETSLTIPNIKYVIDSGKQKTRLYDKLTGVSSFVVTFTSKASADQRAGRAGRVSSGHCYRLYSSAVFNDEFEDFATPDIQKKPIDGLMLQMKCMGIDKVINFPFPSPPDLTQLTVAEKNLILLGTLEEGVVSNCGATETATKITPLGRTIATFPVAPRFGKMLALSHQQNLLPYTVCIVTALSVQEVLLEIPLNEGGDNSDGNKLLLLNKRRNWAGTGNSLLLGDAMVLLKAVGASEYAGSKGELTEFCQKNGLRGKAMIEIRKLRVQLTNEINLNISDVDLCVDPKMEPPTDRQAKFLRQILLAGSGNQVAKKVSENELKDKESRRKFKFAYVLPDMEDPVFMHPLSVLRKTLPEWVIYQEAFEIQTGDTRKTFIRGITAIEPEWLLIYTPQLCNIKNVKGDPTPKYNSHNGKIYCFVEATFGHAGWELPLTEIEMPLSEKSCRYFGMFLLNGDVFKELEQYKKKLKLTPSSIVKSWSNLNPTLAKFTKAIILREINSKNKLLKIWESEPKYLLQEYTDLLTEVNYSEISLNWPPKR